jgi:transposase
MIRKPETNGHGPARATTEIARKATPAVRSAAQKLRILAEYEAYPVGAPERGALLRREGIYTSHISKWRKQRNQGALHGLSAQRRGPKPTPRDPITEENARLRDENARLQARLERAEAIIEVQKKVAALLGTPLPPAPPDAS